MRSRQDHILRRIIVRLFPFVLILTGMFYVLSAQHAASAERPASAQATASRITSSDTVPKTPDITPPARIVISSLGINLGIEKGRYDITTGQWQIDDKHAYLAVQAATPLIYAHNRPALFAHLRNATSTTDMDLIAADGTTTQYHYVKTVIISKDDATVLHEMHSKTVILLTCNGFFDETRRLVYFEETS